MKENDLLDPMQSAYRKGHSTETALLRVHNDIVSAVDKGHGVCLILLDLSAAFDTVDHTILLTFLEEHIGLSGPPLELFKSYLTGRTQCVSIEDIMSELSKLMFGVPQGSVLGPVAFCIYTLPLGAILRHYDIKYHIYADDTQIYRSFDLKNPESDLSRISACISDIRTWMIRNKLKVKDDKTEFLIMRSQRINITEEPELKIGQALIAPSESCRNLGVMFDCRMSMEKQISNICRAAFFHLRNIGAIRGSLPDFAAAQLVHALVTSRLDYCNSLLIGLPTCKIKRLQHVQNVAARIVARHPKAQSIHITPILHELHWLPVEKRILFKVLLLVFRCVNSLAPAYLCDLY